MTTLEMLLNQLANGDNPALPPSAPSMPIPLKTVTPPLAGPGREVLEPPEAPLDTNIIRQYTGLAGERPTAPAPPTRLQRIAAALMGFGAGFEGRGGEFLNQLREPQRRYENRLDDYNQRQASLRLRGEEVARDDQERRTRRAQQLADREFQVEHDRESRRLGLQDDESKMRLQHALQLERDAGAFRRQEVAELQRERRAREDDARGIAGRLSTGPGAAPPEIAKEIGEYQANLRESLSPRAAQWRSAQVRRYEQLVGGGGGGARTGPSNAAMRALANFNGALEEVKGAIARNDVRGERLARRKMDMMHGRLSQFPRDIEAAIGTGGWPYAKLRSGSTPAPGQQPTGPTKTLAEISALAAQAGISVEEGVRRAQAAGFTITQ